MKNIFILLVVCVAMMFVSCSKDDNEKVITDLTGTWKVTKYFHEFKENGKITETSEYGEEKKKIFVLNKDGSSDFDSSLGVHCTWKYEGGKLYFYWSYDNEETDDVVYNVTEFSNDKLIMEWKKSEGNEEEYEKYELKKVDKTTEKPGESSDDKPILPREYERINLKLGEKHYFIGGGGGHYIKYGLLNRFYIGYDANEKQYTALIDMGMRAANAYPPQKPDYISAMNTTNIPIKIHHGYYYYIIYESLKADFPTYFWVERYITTVNGNVTGVSIILPISY